MKKRDWLAFEEARAFVRNLGLKNQQQWIAYYRSGQKPENIPAIPQKVYPTDFKGYGDWLGTGFVARQKRRFLPFKEARAFVRTLGLQNAQQWRTYSASGQRPENIPAHPQEIYPTDFKSYGDWLGTGFVARQKREFLPFEEARAFVRTLGLRDQKQWRAYHTSGQRPENIPTNPRKVYQAQWRGWGDWLGVQNHWSKIAIIAFLEDLRSQIDSLSEQELYVLLQRRRVLPALRLALHKMSTLQIIRTIADPASASTVEHALRKLPAEEVASYADESEEVQPFLDEQTLSDFTNLKNPVSPSFLTEESASANSTSSEIERMQHVDTLISLLGEQDLDLVEDLIATRARLLWDRYSQQGKSVVQEIQAASGGIFFTEIKDRFLAEVGAVESLRIPDGWSFGFTEKSAPRMPNVMQRRIAWMLQEQYCVGNWSKTGTGKTLAGVLASRVCNAHVTLVVTNYATLDGWERQIIAAYPDSCVHRSVEPGVVFDRSCFHYIVLNYERFQGRRRNDLVKCLVGAGIDCVILDEIHLIKQRDKRSSFRLQAIETLLRNVRAGNGQIRVLGASATPVINNLLEAKKLLEVISGEPFPDLDTVPTINNALATYRALSQRGYRERPRYEQNVQTQIISTTRNDLLSEIQEAATTVLSLEQALLPAKLEAVRTHIRRGMMVYTYYVTDIVEPICRFLREECGFSVGCYTGKEKAGLAGFLAGEQDILVGSKPLGTGLDGLQFVCDRLLILSLPWTGAEYEHLLGRIYRQGSAFHSVDIIIPHIVLESDGMRWSWDHQRWELIHYKRTLSDCAVDGFLPTTVGISPQTLLRESRKALEAWIKHVSLV